MARYDGTGNSDFPNIIGPYNSKEEVIEAVIQDLMEEYEDNCVLVEDKKEILEKDL